MIRFAPILLTAMLMANGSAHAQAPTHEQAMRAAIHPVATDAKMRQWLARVPVTRDWPPYFA